ncbi:Cytochrome P450 monooxygenase mpaDE [Lachnellula cervina]|uniref:Cytochrome P450 monooxygenase mpaDE n=1 Tax=Lachnellula cervina TaxID=1316786 RepID=A0A7D8V036_9HELO|nr:Cytochrome P450 monooxygenase mpaDE [Lachnellula cervina]
MSNTYSLIIFQLLLIAVLSRAVYRRFFHPLHIYPGPFLASITNVLKFYYYMQGSLHVVEQELHQQHGPIVRTGPNSLSFSSPEAFESIYGFNHGIEKGDFYAFARDKGTGASNIFSARTHAEHRDRRRKVVGAALTASHVRSYSPIVAKHVQQFLSSLSTASADAKDNVLNIAEPVHAFSFNTFAELIYGPSLSITDQPWSDTASGEGILTAFRKLSTFAWGASHIPSLSWIFSTSPVLKMTRKPTFNAAGIPTGISALAGRARLLLLEDPNLVTGVDQPSIAKSMLVIEKGNSRYMEPGETYKECFNLLFAGQGSTAAALTGILERLGSQDGLAWQDMIRSELKQVNEASESKVLDAVVRESMRYSAPFPSAFPREIQPGAEMAIAGVRTPLPVGTVVASNSWIVSHDKGLWGSDAGLWKPERWLDVKGDAGKKSLEDKFVVFSKGPRGCIGRDITMMILTQVVAAIVSKWRIESTGEMKSSAWLEMQIEWCGLKFTKI